MDPQLDNARNYVALVKMTLGAGTPQYKNFLDILKGYRTGEIAVYDVINQISGLFQGDKELILGFNTFLPDDYKIELSTDDDDNDDVPEGTDTEEDEEKESDGESKQKISAKKRLSIPSNVIVSSKRRKIVHPIPKNRVTPSTRVVLSPLTSTRLPSDLLLIMILSPINLSLHIPLRTMLFAKSAKELQIQLQLPIMNLCCCVIKRVAMLNIIWDACHPLLSLKQMV